MSGGQHLLVLRWLLARLHLLDGLHDHADCTDPVRPVCDQGICSDGAFLCCGCP